MLGGEVRGYKLESCWLIDRRVIFDFVIGE